MYTPKRDNEHPYPIHMGAPSPEVPSTNLPADKFKFVHVYVHVWEME